MRIAKELHPLIGVAVLGAMWTLASATVRQTLGFQTTSLRPLIANRCTSPTQHVALRMRTLPQNVLRSPLLLLALLRMNVLGQPPRPHVVQMVPR